MVTSYRSDGECVAFKAILYNVYISVHLEKLASTYCEGVYSTCTFILIDSGESLPVDTGSILMQACSSAEQSEPRQKQNI